MSASGDVEVFKASGVSPGHDKKMTPRGRVAIHESDDGLVLEYEASFIPSGRNVAEDTDLAR
jgi:hypothetical protein